MLSPLYPIRTERLALRPFALADLDDVFAYRSRPDVNRFLYGGVSDRAETEQWLKQSMALTDLTQEGERLFLAVGLAAHQPVIGNVMHKWTS